MGRRLDSIGTEWIEYHSPRKDLLINSERIKLVTFTDINPEKHESGNLHRNTAYGTAVLRAASAQSFHRLGFFSLSY